MRTFAPGDLERFAALNSDPAVMEHFMDPLSSDGTQSFMNKANREHDALGFGLWALERKDTGEFIGFTGLHHHDGPTPPFPRRHCGPWSTDSTMWASTRSCRSPFPPMSGRSR